MAQSNDDLPFDLSLLEGELQQEEAPDPLDLIDDCDQAEAVPEELLQEALRQLQGMRGVVHLLGIALDHSRVEDRQEL